MVAVSADRVAILQLILPPTRPTTSLRTAEDTARLTTMAVITIKLPVVVQEVVLTVTILPQEQGYLVKDMQVGHLVMLEAVVQGAHPPILMAVRVRKLLYSVFKEAFMLLIIGREVEVEDVGRMETAVSVAVVRVQVTVAMVRGEVML